MKKLSSRTFIKTMYEEVKKTFLRDGYSQVPQRYRSNFVNIGGAFDANYIIWKFLLENKIKKGKILIIGVFGGRDYYGLLLKGYDVHGFDLVNVPDISKLEFGNVEDDLPYADEEFDAVVVAEVLEHLMEDAKALRNINKVLKNDGVLIVTVPFVHDIPEYHIRVHTRKSCQRLLENCNFEILKIVERPAIIRIPYWLNWLHHLIGWTSLKLFGVLPHRLLLPLWGEVEYKIGQIYNPIRHMSSYFGAYYLCKKSANKEPFYISLNQQEFIK